MIALSSRGSYAQNEYFEGDPEWVVVAIGLGFTFDCFYSVVGDTTINGYEYLKIDADPQFSTGDAEVFIYDDAWVRSENKSIWWYNVDEEMDELLYRFEGGIGDTLQIHPSLMVGPFSDLVFVIDQVDSLLIGSEWRKRYYSTSAYLDQRVVLEGIGNSGGLFGKMNNGGAVLKCFTWENTSYRYPGEGGPLDYYNLEEGACNFDLVAENSAPPLEIYPNPAGYRLNIQTMSPQKEIEITDLSGRCVQHAMASGYQSTELISPLSNGIYVCHVILSDGSRHSVRFIKD
ncbi:MAG: T9SS type A sorting domain-containing protein [Flavobacteriales bacterium]